MNDGAAPRGPVLNDEQFRRLAEYGEVEHAEAGRDLYVSGDDFYDFFLLLTATVDIVRDATAIEPERLVYRGGPGDFLGELNLLTGQHVYLTARVVVRRHGRPDRGGEFAPGPRRTGRHRRPVARGVPGTARGHPLGCRQRPGDRRPAGRRGDPRTAHLRRRRCSCRIPGALATRTPGDR